MYPWLIAVHILAATVWTGGHLILALRVLPEALWKREPQVLLDFEARYEHVGLPALLVQIVTGLWLAGRWLPTVGSWFDLSSSVTRAVLLKLLCLAATAALAWSAQRNVIPRLSAETLPLMALHIVGVTLLSVGFVLLGVSFRIGGW